MRRRDRVAIASALLTIEVAIRQLRLAIQPPPRKRTRRR